MSFPSIPGSEKIIRLGVVGIRRGQTFMNQATEALGIRLVAICDIWEERLEQVGREFGVATYTDYARFLEHEMDAVVLANFFHEHAPLAIEALRAGKHVMSETAACKTLAEGVALCRAVEQSGKVYMFAENYPFTRSNLEMRRIYQNGEIGQVLYAEGEYNHPINPDSPYWRSLAPTENHWRNWCPSTYYCTHALAPLMHITGTQPVMVNALSVAAPQPHPTSIRRGDPTSVILCRMDNSAVFRLFGLFSPGHSCWYRVHGTRGAMEGERGPVAFGSGQVRVWHEAWHTEDAPDQLTDRRYVPNWPRHAELARLAGHGGGDFWTSYHFAQGIRGVEPVPLDVYQGVAMSVVGAQAWRSALEEGTPMPIPNFRDEAARSAFAEDHFSPFPEDAGPDQPPPSIQGFNEPSREKVARYLEEVRCDREEKRPIISH